MTNKSNKKTRTRFLWWTRRISWTSAGFYLLVAFEFFYMVSPFAAYLYTAYGPGLKWLASNSATHWLISFYLPHVVTHTKSTLVSAAEIIGIILFIAGLITFAIGAVQIYTSKLRQSESVQGGVYRWIRHPQYSALIIASLGMVLIWPRFLVLLGFVNVVFAYVALARAEEQACLGRFPDYAAYMNRTGMFLPRPLESPFRRVPQPRRKSFRVVLWSSCYAIALGAATLTGLAIKSYTVNSLYTHFTRDAAFVSVGSMSEIQISELADIAIQNPRVKTALDSAGETARFINYILPTEMYVSEIPMYLPKGTITGHTFPEDHNPSRYKIVFTQAHFGPGLPPDSARIIKDALNKSPIVEAWVDQESRQVLRVFPPPADAFYDGMPVPIF